ncbi:MAG: hypothetical protein AB1813_18180 [Verrucomicrobiota bacterium]
MVMIPTNRAERYRKVVIEQALIREKFPCLQTRIKGLELICRGRIQPTEQSDAYRVEIRYSPWNSPNVRVINPAIPFTPGAHMYSNGTLCLYDWREQPWQKRWHLHETIIPWTAEWLVFYELWLLTGKWRGKSATHGTPKPDGFGPPEEDNRN